MVEPDVPAAGFRQAVVIPASGELLYLPATLAALALNPPAILAETLVLAVVNNAAGASPERKEDNFQMLRLLRQRAIPGQEKLRLYWIDAAAEGRELQHGVGDARKTGMDAVLPFLDWAADPLILCLDADTLVEPGYLAAFKAAFAAHPEAAGAVMRFVHQTGTDAAEEAAIRAYENYMEHYVRMLSDAGCPYAYHAMGSAMACRASAYLRAGGMKPRNAGEDFYFLQSLRKLGTVIPVDASTVHPSARPSDRVPFGTGATVRKLTAGNRQYCHHADIFAMLKVLYRTVDTADVEILRALPLRFQETLPDPGIIFLQESGFGAAWAKITANTPATTGHLLAAFHTWFDAFRVMKFVHFCEERFPDRFQRDMSGLEGINLPAEADSIRSHPTRA